MKNKACENRDHTQTNPRTIFVFLVNLCMGCDTYFPMNYFLYFQHNSTTLIVMIFPGTTFLCNFQFKKNAFFKKKTLH